MDKKKNIILHPSCDDSKCGIFTTTKSGQKQTQNSSKVLKYIDAKTKKPTIHVFDDNKFVFVAQKMV